MMVSLSAGIGFYGLTGKIYVDADMLRILEHGASLEIPYTDIVEVERGSFRSWISIKTRQGLYRKMVLPFAPKAYKGIAKEIRVRAELN